MQYNPLTQNLFANDGTLLKKLHCSFSQQWEAMLTTGQADKKCNRCSKVVYDTAFLNEKDIKHLAGKDPPTCCKIDLNQENITIT